MHVPAAEPFLETLHQDIENRLLPLGFRTVRRQFTPQPPGWYAVFDSPGHIVRFIWDGKDGRLMLRVYAKRKWMMKLAKAMLGRSDEEKLAGELLLSRNELAGLEEEQVIEKCADLLKRHLTA
ncbi:hypothetical protein [Paenibacillus humicola]|uniref:hypothetical protein n=1 Tax=Paenibacillus humicola TaxID=3110540 RepID=UPI00237ACB41|nr:hypothetical protein [Paenibacillus humicola]